MKIRIMYSVKCIRNEHGDLNFGHCAKEGEKDGLSCANQILGPPGRI